MARLIAALIRHGEYHQPENVPSAHLPYPLTKKGRDQARMVADDIRAFASGHDFTVAPTIDCSSLLRGWETASVMADALNEDNDDASFHTDQFNALAERSLGSAANLRMDQIEANLARDPRVAALPVGWKSQSGFRLAALGAETLIEAGQRVARHILTSLGRLKDSITEDTLKLFVGHGAAFRHAALDFGILKPAIIPALSMYHARPVYLEWTADGRWAHIGGDWKQRHKTPLLDPDMD